MAGKSLKKSAPKIRKKISKPSARFIPKDPLPPHATRILIIEDDADAVAILKLFFTKHGYEMDIAQDGEEGLRLLKHRHHDLVLSDVMMPKMDGFKFCEQVRSDPEIEMTPIVLITAKNEMPDKIAGLEKGADDYLTKPYNLTELRARIVSMLKLKKLRAELILREKELERIKTLEQTLIAISHHINNATAPIQGRAQLCDPAKTESVKKLIEVCLIGCLKITKTINLLSQVITAMKEPSNKSSFDFTNTSVNELLAQFEKEKK